MGRPRKWRTASLKLLLSLLLFTLITTQSLWAFPNFYQKTDQGISHYVYNSCAGQLTKPDVNKDLTEVMASMDCEQAPLNSYCQCLSKHKLPPVTNAVKARIFSELGYLGGPETSYEASLVEEMALLNSIVALHNLNVLGSKYLPIGKSRLGNESINCVDTDELKKKSIEQEKIAEYQIKSQQFVAGKPLNKANEFILNRTTGYKRDSFVKRIIAADIATKLSPARTMGRLYTSESHDAVFVRELVNFASEKGGLVFQPPYNSADLDETVGTEKTDQIVKLIDEFFQQKNVDPKKFKTSVLYHAYKNTDAENRPNLGFHLAKGLLRLNNSAMMEDKSLDEINVSDFLKSPEGINIKPFVKSSCDILKRKIHDRAFSGIAGEKSLSDQVSSFGRIGFLDANSFMKKFIRMPEAGMDLVNRNESQIIGEEFFRKMSKLDVSTENGEKEFQEMTEFKNRFIANYRANLKSVKDEEERERLVQLKIMEFGSLFCQERKNYLATQKKIVDLKNPESDEAKAAKQELDRRRENQKKLNEDIAVKTAEISDLDTRSKELPVRIPESRGKIESYDRRIQSMTSELANLPDTEAGKKRREEITSALADLKNQRKSEKANLASMEDEERNLPGRIDAATAELRALEKRREENELITDKNNPLLKYFGNDEDAVAALIRDVGEGKVVGYRNGKKVALTKDEETLHVAKKRNKQVETTDRFVKNNHKYMTDKQLSGWLKNRKEINKETIARINQAIKTAPFEIKKEMLTEVNKTQIEGKEFKRDFSELSERTKALSDKIKSFSEYKEYEEGGDIQDARKEILPNSDRYTKSRSDFGSDADFAQNEVRTLKNEINQLRPSYPDNSFFGGTGSPSSYYEDQNQPPAYNQKAEVKRVAGNTYKGPKITPPSKPRRRSSGTRGDLPGSNSGSSAGSGGTSVSAPRSTGRGAAGENVSVNETEKDIQKENEKESAEEKKIDVSKEKIGKEKSSGKGRNKEEAKTKEIDSAVTQRDLDKLNEYIDINLEGIDINLIDQGDSEYKSEEFPTVLVEEGFANLSLNNQKGYIEMLFDELNSATIYLKFEDGTKIKIKKNEKWINSPQK